MNTTTIDKSFLSITSLFEGEDLQDKSAHELEAWWLAQHLDLSLKISIQGGGLAKVLQ